MTKDLLIHTNPAAPAESGGPMAGRRVALQPNLSVRGWPSRAGTIALEDFTALEDSAVAERLNAAGARIIGYTSMAELGLGLNGDTSAAAVSSSVCDAALIADNLGEARVAAAEAGLAGFRPTAGCVSRWGLIGLIPSMETIGAAAADFDAIRALYSAISGPDERDFSLGRESPDFSAGVEWPARAAVISQSLEGLDQAVISGFQMALEVLGTAGLSLEERSFESYDLFRGVHQIIGSAEASSAAGKFDSVRYGHRAADAQDWNEMYIRSRGESFGPLVKAYLFQGAYFQFQDYPAFEDACRVRRKLVDEMEALLRDVGVIVLPTRTGADSAGSAATLSDVYDRFALTLAANVAGLPAVSIPGFMRSESTDFGLQLIGRRLDDGRLLALAQRLMSRREGGS